MNKAQRLALAASVAPEVRQWKRMRPIYVVTPSGEVARTITTDEFVEKICARAGVEFSAESRSRAICQVCDRPFSSVRKNATACASCRGAWKTTRCVCGARPKASAFSATQLVKRKRLGKEWRCTACCRRGVQRCPPEQCVGDGITGCPDGAIRSPRGAAGRWRCKGCYTRTQQPKLRQLLCAGTVAGSCPDERLAPVSAFTPTQVHRRKGEPWRCHPCGSLFFGATRRGREPLGRARLPCEVCGSPVSVSACGAARRRGELPRCSEHRRVRGACRKKVELFGNSE